LTAVDPVIHEAYPMSAKYFLQRRGLPIRTISRAYALELTPMQKHALDAIYARFLGWCERLGIEEVVCSKS
jgi:4-hydroxy-tetrahydrodipicolinate synthase